MNNQKKSVNQNNFLIRSSHKLRMIPEGKEVGNQEINLKDQIESYGAKATPPAPIPASKYLSPIEFNQVLGT